MVYNHRPKKIRDLPKEVLPREKLQNLGAENLTEEELWAIILGKGSKGISVLEISEKITQIGSNRLKQISWEELAKIPGVGKAKALTIKAVLELCNRQNIKNSKTIKHPMDVVEMIKPLIKLKQEHLFVVSLNISQKLISIDLVAVGSLNTVYAPNREVLHPVIKNSAYFFILVHNHPDGQPFPSPEDIQFTQKIKKAAELLDVVLLDHIILDDSGNYYSFKENGLV